jgi:hypothetical protein
LVTQISRDRRGAWTIPLRAGHALGRATSRNLSIDEEPLNARPGVGWSKHAASGALNVKLLKRLGIFS